MKMKVSPSRKAAFEVLLKTEADKAFSSILLPLVEGPLSPRDRALCHQIVLGTLRTQVHLDKIIDHFAGGKKIDLAIRVILRMGLFQLVFLDRVPDHSAVNESVNLTEMVRKRSAGGFVNAVLRRSLREPFEPVFSDDSERDSIETSHPEWLLDRWERQFGRSEALSLARANNEAPRTTFRLTGRSDPLTDLEGATPSENVRGAFRVGANPERFRDLAECGEIYFQDEGSQLVGSILSLARDERFLDVCAAPGSKLSQVASQYSEGENVLVGGDKYGHRVRFLSENCRRQGVKPNIVQYDAEIGLPFADESFDVVLVDAPCSGTGTIGSNPEIRYHLVESDIAELAAKQLSILSKASKMVRKGGRLIYSTCSLESEENEMVVSDFTSEHREFHSVRPDVAERFITEQGNVRTFPQRDRVEGFFAAVLIRDR